MIQFFCKHIHTKPEFVAFLAKENTGSFPPLTRALLVISEYQESRVPVTCRGSAPTFCWRAAFKIKFDHILGFVQRHKPLPLAPHKATEAEFLLNHEQT